MNDLNLDIVFRTPNKKCNKKDVTHVYIKKKIICEFNSNNPLLNAPKKNKVKKFFKNIHTSNNHQ